MKNAIAMCCPMTSSDWRVFEAWAAKTCFALRAVFTV